MGMLKVKLNLFSSSSAVSAISAVKGLSSPFKFLESLWQFLQRIHLFVFVQF